MEIILMMPQKHFLLLIAMLPQTQLDMQTISRYAGNLQEKME